METGSFNKEPAPDLYFYGRRYSDLMDRLLQIREKFLEERGGKDLTKDEIYGAIQNFESSRIEKILSKLNNPNFPWLAHPNDSHSSGFLDATGDTFIDPENKTIYRAENTAFYEDAPTQVEVGRHYSLDSLGKIQVSLYSENEDLEDGLESELNPFLERFEFEDENEEFEAIPHTQLDINHAKTLTEMLDQVIDALEKEYNSPEWYIMPHSINVRTDSREKYYVIEKAQDDD